MPDRMAPRMLMAPAMTCAQKTFERATVAKIATPVMADNATAGIPSFHESFS